MHFCSMPLPPQRHARRDLIKTLLHPKLSCPPFKKPLCKPALFSHGFLSMGENVSRFINLKCLPRINFLQAIVLFKTAVATDLIKSNLILWSFNCVTVLSCVQYRLLSLGRLWRGCVPITKAFCGGGASGPALALLTAVKATLRSGTRSAEGERGAGPEDKLCSLRSSPYRAQNKYNNNTNLKAPQKVSDLFPRPHGLTC